MVQQDDGYASSGGYSGAVGGGPMDDGEGEEYQPDQYQGDYAPPQPYVNGGGDPQEEAGGRAGRATRGRKNVVKDSEDEDAEGEEDDDVAGEDGAVSRPTRGGRRSKTIAKDSEDEEDIPGYHPPPKKIAVTTTSGRQTTRPVYYDGDSSNEDAEVKPTRGGLRRGGSRSTRSGGYNTRDDFVEADEEFDEEDGGYGTGRRSSRAAEKQQKEKKEADRARRAAQRSRSTRPSKVDQSYEGEGSQTEETTDDDHDMQDLGDESDDGASTSRPRRNLRQKQKVDYFAIPPLEAPKEKNKGKGKQRDADNPFAGLPLNMTGAQWAALYPEKGGQPDSVSSGSASQRARD